MKITNKVQTNNIFEISSPTNKVQFGGYFYCSQDWYQTPFPLLIQFVHKDNIGFKSCKVDFFMN